MAERILTKRCRRCQLELPTSEFCGAVLNRDGLSSYCKNCRSIASAKYRKEHPGNARRSEMKSRAKKRENAIAKQRQYFDGHPEMWDAIQPPSESLVRRRRQNRKYWLDHPDRRRAVRLVYSAVAKGVLVKPETCQDCGHVSSRLQGHHADYSRPLDVKWLCPKCHKYTHMNQDPT